MITQPLAIATLESFSVDTLEPPRHGARRRAYIAGKAPSVLCVDDEPAVLEGLADLLRDEFDVTIALGAPEGLAAIRRFGPYTAVIADMRMPEMDGAAFLGRVRHMSPDSVRLLLTGHSDSESAMRAVNEGAIYRFLSKPCSSESLRQALNEAVDEARRAEVERALVDQRLAALTGGLLRAERLAMLGGLASAIGHELSDILPGIKGGLEGIHEYARLGMPAADIDVRLIERALDHLAQHANRLRNLAEPHTGNAEMIGLCELVGDALLVMRYEARVHAVRVDLDLPINDVPVFMERVELEQALLNLLRNAMDALEGVFGRQRRIEVSVSADRARGVAICKVADNGAGIPAPDLPHIFDAYFTTKLNAAGPGLGLFVVKQIIETVGGKVSADSIADVGTTFTIEIPLGGSAVPPESGGAPGAFSIPEDKRGQGRRSRRRGSRNQR